MKDYMQMTITELIDEICRLETIESQELSMDGSGELGGVIHNSFKPFYDKIEEELNTRPEYHKLMERINEDQDDELPF